MKSPQTEKEVKTGWISLLIIIISCCVWAAFRPKPSLLVDIIPEIFNPSFCIKSTLPIHIDRF